MTMTDQADSAREFFRAPCRFFVYYGPESPQSRQAMAMDTGIWDTQADLEATARQILEGGQVSDQLRPLLQVMRWMDFKLETILYHLRVRDRQALFPQHIEVVDISGSGLGVADPGDLAVGSRVLLAMSLPDAPTRAIYAVGEVTRISPEQVAEGRAKAAIRFAEISDHDREQVIRFTFNLQRRLLAGRMHGGEK
jgi:Tfp pilus assembly protein PilZ